MKTILGCLALMCAYAGPAAAAPAPPDTLATAPADTVPTLPGLFLPEGVTLDDILPGADWTPTTGAATDSLLRSGLGVVLAFEDTFSFDPGTLDTVLVDAPRVSIGEVIEAVGRRMEAEARALRDVEYTTLTTVIERKTPTRMGDDYKITEQADRTSVTAERGRQSVQLWKRERTIENGEVVEEDIADTPETSWDEIERGVMMALPFAPGSAGRYRYDITARDLVGNSLVYRIEFEPKSRFEALPSGTVWIDTAHWVIRKLEARMTGTVPFPYLLDSIPVFRMSRERMGEYWFTTDVQIELRLHDVPLLGLPRVVEVRTELRDVEINGLPRSADSLVPRRLRHGTLDPDEFWLAPEAAEDSLRAYWDGIRRVWDDELTPALRPVDLSEARVDSLTRAGSRVLDEMETASPWTVELRTLRTPGFNRVQGAVPRMGATVRRRGPVQPRLDLDAGYGFGNERPEFGARLQVPLLRGEGAGRSAFERRDRGVLSLELSGWKGAALFGGDGRRGPRMMSALLWGGDPNQYLETRGARARLTADLGPVRLWGEGARVEERALEQTTTWNVLGRRLRPDGNLAADELDDARWTVGGAWSPGPLDLDAVYTGHEFEPAAGGDRSLDEFRGGARLAQLDGLGNEWVLRGRYRAFDGQAPRQWRTWLGDWGTLRGYPAGALAGDRAAWASLDLRLGVDLFRALRVPVLKSAGLQPLLFAEHGQAWAEDGPLPDETRTGQLWDVGFGLGKRLDLPFALGTPNLRVYAGRPVGPGTGDEGWRVLVGFER